MRTRTLSATHQEGSREKPYLRDVRFLSPALRWRVDLRFFRSAPLGCRVSSIIVPPSDRIIAGMLATLGRPLHSNELESNGLHGQLEFMEGPEWRDAVQIFLMCWSKSSREFRDHHQIAPGSDPALILSQMGAAESCLGDAVTDTCGKGGGCFKRTPGAPGALEQPAKRETYPHFLPLRGHDGPAGQWTGGGPAAAASEKRGIPAIGRLQPVAPNATANLPLTNPATAPAAAAAVVSVAPHCYTVLLEPCGTCCAEAETGSATAPGMAVAMGAAGGCTAPAWVGLAPARKLGRLSCAGPHTESGSFWRDAQQAPRLRPSIAY